MQSLLLECAAGHKAAAGPASGALASLVRAVRQQSCRTASSVARASSPAEDAVLEQQCPSCSTSGHEGDRDAAGDSGPRSGWEMGIRWGGVRHHLAGLLLRRQPLHQHGSPYQYLQHQHQQQRGVCTSPSALYKFDSHLTRHNKSPIVNRDNFQRFRDSGRDARVAADILQGHQDHRRRGGGGRGRFRSEEDQALLELKSMIHDCRDLRAMQVLVRECGGDMDGGMVCNVLGRLQQLRQDTPPSAAPDVLVGRISDALMPRMGALLPTTSLASLSHALGGLANAGVLPDVSLLAAVHARLTAPGARGDSALLEADPKVVSKLTFAAAKLMDLQRRQAGRQAGGGGRGATGSGGGRGGGEGQEEGGEEEDAGAVLRGRLWPALRDASEAKLLRALGEEPAGAAAVVRRRGAAEGPEEDDSMPQLALRITCLALSLARETHAGTWTAAARLAARHAGELQPTIASGVLRSYAVAGGSALDGGSTRLLDAVWGALGPRVDELELEAQLDVLIAALKLSAARDAAAATADGGVAAAAVPTLCRLVAARTPSLSVADATHLTVALAELHSKTVAAAAGGGGGGGGGAMWQAHPYGALPRLLADLLVLRGMDGFGAGRFASVVLALGLLGHRDPAFWRGVAAAATPEVPRLDPIVLSRLLGGFLNARLAVEATSGSTAAPAAAAAMPAPGAALLVATHARLGTLLDAGAVSGKPLFHLVRSLAEFSVEASGADAEVTSALPRLADRLVSDETAAAEVAAAPLAVRQRLVAALGRAGLGSHELVGRL